MVDDIRVFHHEPDPLSLPSSRFFAMAERLPLRGGAVSHRFALTRDSVEAPPVTVRAEPRAAVAPRPAPLLDISEVIGLSGPNSRGLPWIEYRGGPSS